MRTGLLGGTFDPVHIGHLLLAQEAWYQLELDKVIFVPAYRAPLKKREINVAASDRLNMLRMAVGDIPHFGISTYELDQREECYTVDTVRHFRRVLDGELFFLTGADVAGTLGEWKDAEQLLKEVNFVIATRPGFDKDVKEMAGKIKYISMPSMEISSSSIRDRIAESRPVDFIVPRKVLEYIRNKGLYRS